MDQVRQNLWQRRAQVQAHPFFAWIDSDLVPLESRFVFAPVMIDFIMGFADMNKWFLSYTNPLNERERAINQHTEEDRTHSRLFYENWYTLDIGDVARWSSGKILWWLFHSSDTSIVRRFGMEILDLAVNYPDSFIRFTLMEAIEICGDVFFGHTAPIGERLSEQNCSSHRYFGEYHRARETGHLQADESVFEETYLTNAQVEDCAFVMGRVFDNFLELLDKLLAYALRVSTDPTQHFRDLQNEYARAMSNGLEGSRRRLPTTPLLSPSPSQAALVRKLENRLTRLEQHPLLGWLRRPSDSPWDKLRSFIALWGIDIAGYKDFNELVLRYPAPRSEAELAINRWTKDLATHGVLYLRDWHQLQMDALFGWDAGQTVAFYFLSQLTEVHRKNMARVKKLAFLHQAPVLRWWLMRALESSGEPLFNCTVEIAERIEQQFGVTLDYWSHRHHLTSTKSDGSVESGVLFLQQDITAEWQNVIDEIIDVVFDNMEEQYLISYTAAIDQAFLNKPTTLVPHVSDLFPKQT